MTPTDADIRPRMEAISDAASEWREPGYNRRAAAVDATLEADNTFTEEALAFAINQQMALISSETLRDWIDRRKARNPLRVGVLNAGNIPLVGLQDFLAVVLTGHDYIGTTSSRSPTLLPAFVKDVESRYPSLSAVFVETARLFAAAGAVIATGDDETMTWVVEQCDAHDVPPDRRLLRGHRFSVAVLDGKESDEEYERLAEDVLLHEGLGCRNVAIVWTPADLDPDELLDALARFRGVFPAHESTPRRLKMQQAFLEAVEASHAHGEGLEFLVSKGEPEEQPPGHLRWTEYRDLEDVQSWIRENADRIQLAVAREGLLQRMDTTVPVAQLGQAQRPSLDWCPDGIDTVDFLVEVS